MRAWSAWSDVLNPVPFWYRLSTRVSLLLLAMVAVLAGSSIILLGRGINLAQQGLADGVATADMDAIVRSTVINLVALFLLTMVAATVFSRQWLVEPINDLAQGVAELRDGNLGVTLPAESQTELGELARSFNAMSARLKEQTENLTESNEALRESERRYAEALELTEQRVQERTGELQALLEVSREIALTVDLHPLLEGILRRLNEAVPYDGAVVLEHDSDRLDKAVVARGSTSGKQRLALPLVARDHDLGQLLLFRSSDQPFRPDSQRVAMAFANQVAIALENNDLYEQVHRQAAYEERQHLARELHDSVSQALYGILLGTHTAQKQLADRPEKAASALEYVENLASAGLAEMRALIFELRPEALERDGLVGALSKQLDALESRHDLETHAQLGEEPDIPLATKQVVYRIAQEATHNVVKHAHASAVWLDFGPAAGGYRLTVRDDGQGFDDQASFTGHFGLSSMRERASALGGSLNVSSVPGQGTTVTLDLPQSAVTNGNGERA